MIPSVIPMLTKLWNASHATTPAATSRPKTSVAREAIRSPRHSTTPSRASSVDAPSSPSSSPATVKMKSVCCSGMKFPRVCVPSNSPLPNTPPEPIAMRAWLVL